MKIAAPPSCILFFTGLLCLSCSHLDEPGPVCGGLLEYQAGDSVAICFSDSSVSFVGSRGLPNHYNLEAYLLREFQLATDAGETIASSPYNLAFFHWKQESWDVRRSFLPFPFRYDAVGADSAEFMFLIATYPEQFSFGWTDAYLEDVDLNDPALGHIWFNDNPQTVRFDGRSEAYETYLDMLIYLR